MVSAWMMFPAEEPKKLSKNIFTKAIAKGLNKARRLSFRKKTAPISDFDSVDEFVFESDDAFESRVGKFQRGDSCSTVDSPCESLPSLPGSVESDNEEDEFLHEDACYDQPELMRVANLVRQRSCQNKVEIAPEESEQTETCMDNEFLAEKAKLKALVRSFAKEANSGLKCSIFEDQTCAQCPAQLFLDRSLTMTLVHNGRKICIPLTNVVAAYSLGDLRECSPNSKLPNNVSGVEDLGAVAFIQQEAPGVPESWVSLKFADEESMERCVISINVLQKLAEMRQQRYHEHLAKFA